MKIKISVAPEFISHDEELAEKFNYDILEQEIMNEWVGIEIERINSNTVPLKMFELIPDNESELEYISNFELFLNELALSDDKFYQ